MRDGAKIKRGTLSDSQQGRPDPSTLPAVWTLATVEEVAERIVDCEHSTAKFVKDGLPCVDTTCIKPGRIVKDKLRFVDKATYKLRTRRLVPENGDIIFAREGTVGTAVRVPAGMQLCLGQRVMLLRPGAAITSAYLENVLNSIVVRTQYLPKIIGSTAPHLNVRDVRELTIPVPPLNEQRRIVAAIEANLTRLDAGVAGLERVRAKLRRYRAAVLKAACEGRLVPTEAELARAEGRDYETAERFLARIQQENRDRREPGQVAKSAAQGKKPVVGSRRAKHQSPSEPIIDGMPELPKGWCWSNLGSLIREPLCNGISVKGSMSPPGVPALRLNAMTDSGLDYQVIRYLPISKEIAEDLEVFEGDFFVSRGNGSLALVGRGAFAQAPPFQVVFPDTMIRVRLLPSLTASKWVPRVWPSALIRRQLEARVKTTAGIWKIAQPQVESIAIPLPPLAEQARIVAEVERRLSLIDELDAAVAANLKRAERLRQSILKRAFEGKLVPQDPADEPAEALLARIRNPRARQGQIRFDS